MLQGKAEWQSNERLNMETSRWDYLEFDGINHDAEQEQEEMDCLYRAHVYLLGTLDPLSSNRIELSHEEWTSRLEAADLLKDIWLNG